MSVSIRKVYLDWEQGQQFLSARKREWGLKRSLAAPLSGMGVERRDTKEVRRGERKRCPKEGMWEEAERKEESQEEE